MKNTDESLLSKKDLKNIGIHLVLNIHGVKVILISSTKLLQLLTVFEISVMCTNCQFLIHTRVYMVLTELSSYYIVKKKRLSCML